MQANANKGQYFLRVDLDDLNNFDDELGMVVRENPGKYIPAVSDFIQDKTLISLKKQLGKYSELTMQVQS